MNKESQIKLAKSIFIICWSNFICFWILAVYLGGDAINGKIQNGHYYLMSHGHFTEVKENIFIYSKWHTVSTWFTHFIGALSGLWFLKLKKLPPFKKITGG